MTSTGSYRNTTPTATDAKLAARLAEIDAQAARVCAVGALAVRRIWGNAYDLAEYVEKGNIVRLTEQGRDKIKFAMLELSLAIKGRSFLNDDDQSTAETRLGATRPETSGIVVTMFCRACRAAGATNYLLAEHDYVRLYVAGHGWYCMPTACMQCVRRDLAAQRDRADGKLGIVEAETLAYAIADPTGYELNDSTATEPAACLNAKRCGNWARLDGELCRVCSDANVRGAAWSAGAEISHDMAHALYRAKGGRPVDLAQEMMTCVQYGLAIISGGRWLLTESGSALLIGLESAAR